MPENEKHVLGVEGGGSKTNWVFLKQSETKSELIESGELPSSNLKLTSRTQLTQMLQLLPSDATDVGIFLAGCVTKQDRNYLLEIAKRVWPNAQIQAGSDRESALAAAFGDQDGIAVISGTGSAVTGRKGGRVEKAGGRGHLLGDRGGAYVISIEGLRLALRTYDLEHRISALAQNILRDLALSDMEDLMNWVQSADKTAISSLAPVLFATAMAGDQEMMSVIVAGARALARYTESVAQWLEFESPDVRLLGSIFLKQPMYVHLYETALNALLETSSVSVCSAPGSFGAAWLAVKNDFNLRPVDKNQFSKKDAVELSRASTEQLNPKAIGLGKRSTKELVQLMVDEEQNVASALQACNADLAQAIEIITSAFLEGGRLFYVGAGTSGRLGVLDASEIPPTFGEPPERVQGIIAGGVQALHKSIEGAEDEPAKGKLAIRDRGVTQNDVVCGISASGRTPFVIGALEEAKQIGAKIIFLTCNPAGNRSSDWDVRIDLPTGPEIITGSTRLKAGTATKVALNILTTCSMIKIGKTKDNWMIDLKPVNSKLKIRSIRLVSRLKNVSDEDAEKLLNDADWNIRKVL
jgi:N-acetylmuramic acid 6-phosphate etherase